MKKTIAILALSLLSLQFQAQNFVSEIPNLEIAESAAPGFVKGAKYLKSVKGLNTPAAVWSLQEQIARFDLTTDETFDGRKDVFKVTLKGDSGKIHASMASDGTLLSTSETYKNIPLPLNIREKLSADHGLFSQIKNQLNITYEQGQDPTYCYKVVIQVDGKRRTLTFTGPAD